MEYELSLLTVLALIVAGVVAGFINTLAGGGSMLTLPALMLLGMPAEVANASNRVGVLLQSITGARGFQLDDRLDSSAIAPILLPTCGGALLGALVASYLPVEILKPALLGSMVTMALVMLIWPTFISVEVGEQVHALKERPAAAAGLFVAGVYGGFVQAGVGFILIAALAGGLRYDLVRANALKMVCTALFSIVALVVFVSRGQVLWVPGLILALGMVTGAYLSVKFAVRAKQNTLKWIVFAMVCLTCGGAILYR
jgi:uncharacterized membrane protein YfcA